MDESRPAAQPTTWTAGAKIADRYTLVERIAGGGMGDVWRGQDEVLGRTVAIKVLRSEHAEDEDFRERLRREARAAGSISHPGVVPVFDYGEELQDNGMHLSYLVMEHIDGPSLSTELRGRRRLGTGRTLAIISQTAEALQAAHDAGVVHRDIKPGNILVTPDGDVKITDFGIARSADSRPMTLTGTLTGTAQYISPEQASGSSATNASDIYSLGVVAYRCLAGDVPFSEGNEITIAIAHMRDVPPDLPADVPAGVRALVMLMLAKDPEDRPASAGVVAFMARELIESLDDDGGPTQTQAVAESETTRAHAESPLSTAVLAIVSPSAGQTKTRRPRQGGLAAAIASRPRSRRFQAIGAMAALILLGGAGVMAMQNDEVTIPDIVGKQQTAAQQLLTEDGLTTTVKIVNAPGKQAGIVVSQTPVAGTAIQNGGSITLGVATGLVDIPDEGLIGETYEVAAAQLEKLGLKPVEESTESTEQSGTVVDVDPGATAQIGSEVTLRVAVAAPAPTQPANPEKRRGKSNDKYDDKDDDKDD